METVVKRKKTVPSPADLLYEALGDIQNPFRDTARVVEGVQNLIEVYQTEYDAMQPCSKERQLLCEELGFCYKFGIGLSEPLVVKAYEIWARGDTEGSKYCHAQMLCQKYGKYHQEAAVLFAELALEENHRLALVAHGFRQQDPVQARVFYKRAVELHNPVAMYNMWVHTRVDIYLMQAVLYGFTAVPEPKSNGMRC